jgi:hypothetical protein
VADPVQWMQTGKNASFDGAGDTDRTAAAAAAADFLSISTGGHFCDIFVDHIAPQLSAHDIVALDGANSVTRGWARAVFSYVQRYPSSVTAATMTASVCTYVENVALELGTSAIELRPLSGAEARAFFGAGAGAFGIRPPLFARFFSPMRFATAARAENGCMDAVAHVLTALKDPARTAPEDRDACARILNANMHYAIGSVFPVDDEEIWMYYIPQCRSAPWSLLNVSVFPADVLIPLAVCCCDSLKDSSNVCAACFTLPFTCDYAAHGLPGVARSIFFQRGFGRSRGQKHTEMYKFTYGGGGAPTFVRPCRKTWGPLPPDLAVRVACCGSRLGPTTGGGEPAAQLSCNATSHGNLRRWMTQLLARLRAPGRAAYVSTLLALGQYTRNSCCEGIVSPADVLLAGVWDFCVLLLKPTFHPGGAEVQVAVAVADSATLARMLLDDPVAQVVLTRDVLGGACRNASVLAASRLGEHDPRLLPFLLRLRATR